MATFLLIHGAWHGRWCWDALAPLLEVAGHKVVAIDLPGLGDDQTPLQDVSLGTYASAVAEAVRAQGEPVVLVGHSMGGLVITQAAELVPDGIAALVYLAAFLPGDGQNLLGLSAQADPFPLVMAPDGLTATVAEKALVEIFYADVPPALAAAAAEKLRPQALAPLTTPVATSAARFGSVPRHYIECAQDRAIPLALQQAMHRAQPCASVHMLDTSHSPFLSAPEDLAQTLMTIAA